MKVAFIATRFSFSITPRASMHMVLGTSLTSYLSQFSESHLKVSLVQAPGLEARSLVILPDSSRGIMLSQRTSENTSKEPEALFRLERIASPRPPKPI